MVNRYKEFLASGRPVVKRTWNSVHFRNPEGTVTAFFFPTPINYLKAGKYTPIVSEFVVDETGEYAYKCETGVHKVYVKDDTTVVIEKRGYKFQTKIIGLAYVNRETNEYVIVQTPNAVTPTLKDERTVVFEGLFTGVDVTYLYSRTWVKEFVSMSKAGKDSLPKPADYGLTPAKTVVALLYEVDYGDESIDFTEDIDLVEPMRFRDSEGKVIHRLPLGKAVDALKDRWELMYRFMFKTPKNQILCGLPYTWATHANRRFPLVLDPNYYTGAGDGEVRNSNADWTTCRDATSGTAYYTANNFYLGGSYDSRAGLYYIHRGFLPIDTSGIPSGATITAAVLHIWNYAARSVTAYVVQTTQASTSSLVADDYDNVGSVDGGNAVIGGSTAFVEYTITLNATGRSWVTPAGWTKIGLRETHDFNNTTPTIKYDSMFCTSEYADTTYDPYLEVTYTPGGWTGKISGVTDPAKVMGVAVANIAKVKGVS